MASTKRLILISVREILRSISAVSLYRLEQLKAARWTANQKEESMVDIDAGMAKGCSIDINGPHVTAFTGNLAMLGNEWGILLLGYAERSSPLLCKFRCARRRSGVSK